MPCEYPNAVAVLTRAQRRQHRDGVSEWILIALIALTVVLTFYVVIIR